MNNKEIKVNHEKIELVMKVCGSCIHEGVCGHARAITKLAKRLVEQGCPVDFSTLDCKIYSAGEATEPVVKEHSCNKANGGTCTDCNEEKAMPEEKPACDCEKCVAKDLCDESTVKVKAEAIVAESYYSAIVKGMATAVEQGRTPTVVILNSETMGKVIDNKLKELEAEKTGDIAQVVMKMVGDATSGIISTPFGNLEVIIDDRIPEGRFMLGSNK